MQKVLKLISSFIVEGETRPRVIFFPFHVNLDLRVKVLTLNF